jgi:hypothetical protein
LYTDFINDKRKHSHIIRYEGDFNLIIFNCLKMLESDSPDRRELPRIICEAQLRLK